MLELSYAFAFLMLKYMYIIFNIFLNFLWRLGHKKNGTQNSADTYSVPTMCEALL